MSFKILTSADVIDEKLDSFPSPTGDGTEPVYSERTGRDGIYEVYESGRKNLQDEIEAALEDTLIYNVLRRVSNGEYDLLNRHIGVYADVTGVPTTIFDLERTFEHARDFYDGLPAEVKSQFSDFDDFMSAAVSDIARIKTAFGSDQPSAAPAAAASDQQNAQTEG